MSVISLTRSDLDAVLGRLSREHHRWLASLPAPESAFVLLTMHTFGARVVATGEAAYKLAQAEAA